MNDSGADFDDPPLRALRGMLDDSFGAGGWSFTGDSGAEPTYTARIAYVATPMAPGSLTPFVRRIEQRMLDEHGVRLVLLFVSSVQAPKAP